MMNWGRLYWYDGGVCDGEGWGKGLSTALWLDLSSPALCLWAVGFLPASVGVPVSGGTGQLEICNWVFPS